MELPRRREPLRLAEAELQEVTNDPKFDEAVARLRGNENYEVVVSNLKEVEEAMTDELVLNRDPNDVLRAQGGVRLIRLLIQNLAP